MTASRGVSNLFFVTGITWDAAAGRFHDFAVGRDAGLFLEGGVVVVLWRKQRVRSIVLGLPS